ncbi:MAG: hypothetical protein FJ388_17020 [Verrucomicrobia bacterium]|nr:hypothetical protein [Verrucomicrobiota bacterium]
MTFRLLALAALAVFAAPATSAQPPSSHAISVPGTKFLLDGAPFPFTGISFFNAIYNPAFNKDSATRRQWLEKLYHHDMFQTGYGSPAVPPSGVPDPEFNPYHRQVLEFIAQRPRYEPEKKKP